MSLEYAITILKSEMAFRQEKFDEIEKRVKRLLNPVILHNSYYEVIKEISALDDAIKVLEEKCLEL